MSREDSGQHQKELRSLRPRSSATPLSLLSRYGAANRGLAALTVDRLRLPTSWQFWLVLGLLGVGGAGIIGTALLFRIPGLPNCPRIFWPTASGSLRLYCAQVAAEKQTLDNLLEAIALVNNLPQDHPLRPDINRWVEKWSLEILELGEKAFQGGRLAQAMEIAEKVPENTRAHTQIPERAERWRSIWTQAEGIYQRAEAELQQENWRRAFSQATRLLGVDNRYWQTTQYDALNQKIIVAQQDEQKLSKARQFVRQGGLDNLVAAMELLQKLSPNTYFHKSAQETLEKASRSLLDLAAAALSKQNLQDAVAIAERVPANTTLSQEAQDFIELANAQSWTWSDSILGLSEAINQAQQLGPNRPLYSRAQQLIAQWQLEIQALEFLIPARGLAQLGGINSLRDAIAQAQRIPAGNPRWQEAQQDISQWTREIQTIEDQPILDQADQLATAGDSASLNSAIRVAQRIQPGRALYSEVQNRVEDWGQQIQAEKDRQQQQRQVEAADLQGEQLLQTGRDLANRGTPKALASAIRTVNAVSSFSSWRYEADQAMDEWSYQILEMARQRASNDRAGAIAIAQQVPRFSGAFTEAQSQIQDWQRGN